MSEATRSDGAAASATGKGLNWFGQLSLGEKRTFWASFGGFALVIVDKLNFFDRQVLIDSQNEFVGTVDARRFICQLRQMPEQMRDREPQRERGRDVRIKNNRAVFKNSDKTRVIGTR